jgi:protein-S-isoprenylcysteine O-methyltransferase Ste14
MSLESAIRSLAALLGGAAIAAPVIRLLLITKRDPGRSLGTGAPLRTGPAVLFMTLLLVGTGTLLWKPLPLYLPATARLTMLVAGGLAYLPGITFYLWGLLVLGAEFGVSSLFGAALHAGHRLVTHGPYALVRHPMYLGVLLAAGGALLIFRTWAMILFAPLSLVVSPRARREEVLLCVEFGESWMAYAAKVPKWIPRLR